MRRFLERIFVAGRMNGFFSDPHRRHLALTALVAAALAAYLTGAVRSVYGFNVALLAALVGGLPIFYGALSELVNRRISADLAVGLAAVAAMAIGQFAVAAEVVLIMLIGEALENYAVGRTRSAIAALLALRPETVRVRRGENEHVLAAADVHSDDVVLVRPGDRIGVDGRVLAGASSVDQSPITGESVPADKAVGDEVFAGTINLYGALEVAIERLGQETALERIIHLVEEAEEAKAPTQRLADRYATWFVPTVLLVAGVTWLATGEVVRSVAVLVVACPCALVLATPTAIAAGVGRLVRRGVLVKGGAALEQLGRLRAVVFDKTGTLTEARLRVRQVVASAGVDEAEVLRLAGAVERQSEHPIGKLISSRAAEAGVAGADAADFTAVPGLGASATVGGHLVRVGNGRLMEQGGVAVPEELRAEAERLGQDGCTVVLVGRGAEAVGAVAVADTIRDGAGEAVERLRALGVERVAMLTGDNAAAARSVGEALGIDDVRSELLPADKVDAVRRIQAASSPVAMVGDGINDAPSLVAADVGVAMAEVGTDVAIDSAGVVLLGDRLAGLADAVATGRRALRIVWQNILGFALVFNAVAVLIAAMGWIDPIAAAVLGVFGYGDVALPVWVAPVVAATLHQISSLIVCLNSLRLLVSFGAWWRRIAGLGRSAAARWRWAAGAAGAAAAAIWLSSGLHTVQIGEVSVVQRFGKVVASAAGPGMHYRLPAPFGKHTIVRTGQVRRVEIGFRTIPGVSAEPPAYEWNLQHRGGRSQRRDAEAVVWAGDEKLVDVNLVVHYRVADAVKALLAVGQATAGGEGKWDALIRGVTESAVREELARRESDGVLGGERSSVEAAIRRRLVAVLRPYGAGLEVEAVCLADVHPPLEVVPDFRDVASALEEKEANINQAKAYLAQTKAVARGRARQTQRSAEGKAADRARRAEGQAARFTAAAKAFAGERELTRLRMYLQTVERVLAGRRKVIVDGEAARRSRRVLLLGPRALWPLTGGVSGGGEPAGDDEEGSVER